MSDPVKLLIETEKEYILLVDRTAFPLNRSHAMAVAYGDLAGHAHPATEIRSAPSQVSRSQLAEVPVRVLGDTAIPPP